MKLFVATALFIARNAEAQVDERLFGDLSELGLDELAYADNYDALDGADYNADTSYDSFDIGETFSGNPSDGGRRRPDRNQLAGMVTVAPPLAAGTFDYGDYGDYGNYGNYGNYNSVEGTADYDSKDKGNRPGNGDGVGDGRAGTGDGSGFDGTRTDQGPRSCFVCEEDSIDECRDNGGPVDCMEQGEGDYCMIEIRVNQFMSYVHHVSMRCAQVDDCDQVTFQNVEELNSHPAAHDQCRPKTDESGNPTHHWLGRYRNLESVCRTCSHVNDGLAADGGGSDEFRVGFGASGADEIRIFKNDGNALEDGFGNSNMLEWALNMWNDGTNLAYHGQGN